ncbi:MAG: amino acid permease [Candidatus Lumbricidophila eiseniae]|uniref:Amino acid permease n=1 Tax=Candidatus Lumbricidiphila eiseniae TaxID=1969409 RepID=A0A2A6FPC0_9MICO|nr:MAG: amino acid permease [Candidatus Lumbricidophila eiseniae]
MIPPHSLKSSDSVPTNPAAHEESAQTGMTEFGYSQTLERSLGGFATFAAGVSFISILTGCSQLFYFGFSFGGPAYWWTWPMVFIGQVMVALTFAELAARYPVAGSVYNWAKRLSNPSVSWLAGWLLIFASIFTLAGVALALQITLPQIWNGFQIVGDGNGKYDFALNGVLLGAITIIFTTVINAYGVKLMSIINSTGVVIELIATVALAIWFVFHINQPVTAIFETNGTGDDRPGGYLSSFLIAALASGFVMFGFDTASSLGEETKDPKKSSPRAILRAVIASFLIGGALLFFGILSAKDLSDPKLGSGDGGLQYLVLQAFGQPAGTIFLIAIAIAIIVCALTIHTACIRAVFAMARDNNLPFARALSSVNSTTKTPVAPAIVIGVIALTILFVNVGQPQIFTVVTSVAVVLIYAAYLMVTIPMLVRRLQGAWPGEDIDKRYFRLGRWGLPVNIVAVLWGLFMGINILWPREETYGVYPWGGVLILVAITGFGFAYYWFKLRHNSGVLEAHRAIVDAGHRGDSPDQNTLPDTNPVT